MSELSPFRLLAREYAADLITREEYIKLRSNLLVQLQEKGVVNLQDLQNFARLHETTGDDDQETKEGYSRSDWLIIALGLIASLVLAYILYT